MSEIAILGAYELPYRRRSGVATRDLLAQAVIRVVEDSGYRLADIDGLGVASFSFLPERAIDLAWSLGISPRWIMDDGNGGASSFNLLQHAWRALQAGDAGLMVLVAGDAFGPDDFARLVNEYNHTTRERLQPLRYGGPNALFAMLTQRQMRAHGLERADYGRLVTTQRAWAGLNPGAVYRTPLSLEEYLAAPMVAEPLGLYDCVPVVDGANALILGPVSRAHGRHAVVAGVAAQHNTDGQMGDGLSTGLAAVAEDLWQALGTGPEAMDVMAVYDDYPAMVLAQLADMGFAPDGDLRRLVQRIASRELPVNTSGGQLSAGQAGTAGGMHALVEVAKQLMGQAGERQVAAQWGLATGYGMVEYRYGMCAAAAVLRAGGSA